jgi:hypothetical protein
MPLKSKKFYVALAVLMTILVFVGFWPTYFGLLLTGDEYERHWVFHVHATVFLAWMAVFIAQTILIARRKTKVHMAVGTRGFILATAVFVMGVVVSFVLMFQGFDEGVVSTWPQAVWEASAPLMDISQFAILIGLGWWYRRKPEFHKRYMVLATVALLPAATSRMEYLLGPWSLEAIFGVLVAVLVVHDFRQQGRVHAANIVGVLILVPRVLLNISFKYIA